MKIKITNIATIEILIAFECSLSILLLTKPCILSHVLRKLNVLCCKKYLKAINNFVFLTIKVVITLFLSKAVKQIIFRY